MTENGTAAADPIEGQSTDAPEHSDQYYDGMFREMVANLGGLIGRGQLLDWLQQGQKRDIDSECGYPDFADSRYYQRLYDGNAIAARVVEVFALESWQVQPTVYEQEKSAETPFEKAWKELAEGLSGEKNYHREERGSVIWEYLLRADIVSGIGRYGVIFLGLDDGEKDYSTPVAPVAVGGKPRKLLYLRVFSEAQAPIAEVEQDKSSPRYGQPKIYNLNFASPTNIAGGGTDGKGEAVAVHWTRVIHIADNINQSEILGTPRLQQVLHPVLDAHKVRGGSAEMYWLGAFAGVAITTHPQLGPNARVDPAKVREAVRRYYSHVDRAMFLKGLDAKSLSPQVSDPTAFFKIQIKTICIRIAMPERIFEGSERGQLASGQDDEAWNDRLRARQANYITPRIIRLFVNRLINLGVLPVPPKGYAIFWPDISSQTPEQKAAVAKSRTETLALFVQSGIQSIIQLEDFYTMVFGLTLDEAEAVVKAVRKALEGDNVEQSSSPLLGLVGGIGAMLELFKQASDGVISEEQAIQLIMLFFKVDEKKALKIWADGIPEKEPPPAPIVDPTLLPQGGDQDGQQQGKNGQQPPARPAPIPAQSNGR